MVVIDEGHRAYTDLARDSLLGLNPSFVLELTATPNTHGHRSNVLVSVSGVALKGEQMIKLPINVHNLDGETWRGATRRGLQILSNLADGAAQQQRSDGRYVRPIMLVRVEATGRDRRDGVRIHTEDVREYLERDTRYSTRLDSRQNGERRRIGRRRSVGSRLPRPDCPD